MSVATLGALEWVALDPSTLMPPVRKLLDDHTAEIVSEKTGPLREDHGSPSGVYRVSGTGQVQDDTVPWALVLTE